MKTVGIIGGLGPETTAEFYLRLILGFRNLNANFRPPILMWSIPMDLKVEEDLIVKNENVERYLPFLIEAAKRLEEGGADFIVIPCNSVHIFIDQIRNSVKIPVKSIIEETSKVLIEESIKKVLLLATKTTLDANLYQSILNSHGVATRTLGKSRQEELHRIINDIVNIKAKEKHQKELVELITKSIPQDNEAVLLACTDLQIILNGNTNFTIFDSMKILLESTLNGIIN